MERCGLDPALKLPVRKYSLGMKQRLGIAQAIMEDIEILCDAVYEIDSGKIV